MLLVAGVASASLVSASLAAESIGGVANVSALAESAAAESFAGVESGAEPSVASGGVRVLFSREHANKHMLAKESPHKVLWRMQAMMLDEPRERNGEGANDEARESTVSECPASSNRAYQRSRRWEGRGRSKQYSDSRVFS
jgi:hypothetical protein